MKDKFEELEVEIIAISSDTEEDAAAFKKRAGIAKLKVGYNLPTEMAISWGLYLSEPTLTSQQRIYNEPGLFLVRADGVIHCAATSSMPIWEPDLDVVLAQFVDLKDRPNQRYHTTFVPVVIPEREQLSFRNGRGAPPIWRST